MHFVYRDKTKMVPLMVDVSVYFYVESLVTLKEKFKGRDMSI